MQSLEASGFVAAPPLLLKVAWGEEGRSEERQRLEEQSREERGEDIVFLDFSQGFDLPNPVCLLTGSVTADRRMTSHRDS
jgi:hypothetical protein